jgi:hypothetical protein
MGEELSTFGLARDLVVFSWVQGRTGTPGVPVQVLPASVVFALT